MSRLDTTSHDTRRLRALLRAGSALPLLVGTAALANPIVEDTDDDIAVTAASATGTPVAVELYSGEGSITANVTTVTATAAQGDRDYVIGLETGTDGAINAEFGSITVSGQGQVLALGAETVGGDITIKVGTVTAAGAATAGVQAHSVSGDIALEADSVILNGTGIDSDFEIFPEAILALSSEGSASIVAGHAETRGQFGTAVAALGGTTASIEVETAISHSDGAVTAYVSGADGATLTAGTIEMLGDGNAVEAYSDGDVSITADEIESGGGGIYSVAGGDITVAVGDVSSIREAIEVESEGGGDISVTADDLEVNGAASALLAKAVGDGGVTAEVAYASSAVSDAGTIHVTTQAGDIDISVDDVQSSANGGMGLYAHSVDGDVTLDVGNAATTGLLMGDDYTPDAVVGLSDNGTATVVVGTVTTEGQYSSAAAAQGGAGASVTVGSASSAGASGAIVYAGSGQGDAHAEAGTITLRGTGQSAVNVMAENGLASVVVDEIIDQGTVAYGIYARGAQVDVTLGTAAVDANAVRGIGVNGGSVSIETTGDVTSNAIALRATGGAIDITTAADTTVTSFGHAIWVENSTSADIENGGTVSVSGGFASGILVNSTGDVSIMSNAVEVTGAGSDPGVGANNSRIPQGGIVVNNTGGGATTIDAGSIDVAGEYRFGLYVGTNGAATVSVDEVTLASADSAAVSVRGGVGDVSITTGTVTTTGISGAGVVGSAGEGDVTINAGVTNVTATGRQGLFAGDAVVGRTTSGNVSITSEDARTVGLNAVAVLGNTTSGNVTIDSGYASGASASGNTIFAQSLQGSVTVDAEETVATGDQGRAVFAAAQQGVATVRVDDVTTTGVNSIGVLTAGLQADITVDGTVTTTGASVVASNLGRAHVVINGDVTSSAAAGVATISQQGLVEVETGATVTGLTGVGMSGGPQGGFSQLFNSGTITGTGENGAAIAGGQNNPQFPPNNIYIKNNGTLRSAGAYVVNTAGGEDTLELTERSDIVGVVNLGDGHDDLTLDFDDDALGGDAVGQVVATVNVESLNVFTGTWRAEGQNSYYDHVEISEGATLTIAENDEDDVAISTQYVELDGRLNLELVEDVDPSAFTEGLIEGIGSVHLTGTAAVVLTDTTGLQYTGGTFVEGGSLILAGAFGGDITTSGGGVFELAEGGDFTGDLVNNGTFLFSQAGDYAFTGDFTGTGGLTKDGAGKLTFAGLYGFTGTTSVLGGSVAFTGQLAEDTELDLTDGTVDLSEIEGGTQTIAQLEGEGGELILGETQLVIDQMGNTVFSGSITGMGEIVKEGDGDLKLDGDSDFSGTGTVNNGTLSVNGDVSNANFVVNEGGTLGGSGTVGDTQINAGGALGPGNSIGTLTIDGDLTLASTSVYEVEVDATGASDRTDVTGTATLGGAHVEVIAASGTYRPLTDYTILTAEGGVEGTFGSVETNLAFLDPTLLYSDDEVTLRLTRNDIDFAAYGTTANQRAIANLIESYGFGNTLYDETLTLIDDDVAISFASLTGEVYPAYSSALVETAELLRRQTGVAATGAAGTYVWATGLANKVDGGNALSLSGKGVAGGFGFGAEWGSVSVGIGQLDQGSSGQVDDGDVTFLVGQIAVDQGGFSLRAGVQFGWAGATVSRTPVLGTLNQAANGEIDANYESFFGEVAYGIDMGGLTIQPFAGLSKVSIDTDALAETGGATALTIDAAKRGVAFGRLGVRLAGSGEATVKPYASAAWRRAWNDRAATAEVGFGANPGSATITAIPVAKTAAELEAGLTLDLGGFELEAGYTGLMSSEFDSHGGKLGVKFRF